MMAIADTLCLVVYGDERDHYFHRDYPHLSAAFREGGRVSNRRWNIWLQRQGYSQAQANHTIGTAMEEIKVPGILDKAVSRIAARGVKKSSAYPIAVATLQRAGDLKKGTLAATAKGVARNKMSQAQRRAKPP